MTQQLTGRLEVEYRGSIEVVRVDGDPRALFGLDIAKQLEESVSYR